MLTDAVAILGKFKHTSAPIARAFSSSSPVFENLRPASSQTVIRNRVFDDGGVRGIKTVRVLSIDGGGIRGIIPLKFLQRIQNEVNNARRAGGLEQNLNIHQMFDVIAGTSSGGIIALGLSSPEVLRNTNLEVLENENLQERQTPSEVDQLLRIFRTRGSELFKKTSVYDVPTSFLQFRGTKLFAPKYEVDSLERLMNEHFCEIRIRQAKTNVLVPAYDIDYKRIHVFHSFPLDATQRDIWNDMDDNAQPWPDFYMKDVARVISAAPTYFLPQSIRMTTTTGEPYRGGLKNIIDAGIVVNNPAMLSYIHAKRLFPQAERFYVLSLSTGEPPPKAHDFAKPKDGGLYKWGSEFLNVLSGATNSIVHTQMKNIPGVQIVRLPITRLEEEIPLDAIDRVGHIEDIETGVINNIAAEGVFGGIVREILQDRGEYPSRRGEGLPSYDPMLCDQDTNYRKWARGE